MLPMQGSTFHNIILICILITGCIVTYFSYSFSENLAVNHAQQQFNEAAIARINEIKDKLHHTENILLALKAFFDSSDDVTKNDFSSFSTVLTKHHPEFSTVAWLEKISPVDVDLNQHSNFQYPVRYRLSNNNDNLNSVLIDDESLASTIMPIDSDNVISMTVLETKSERNLIRLSVPIFSKEKNSLNKRAPVGFLVMIVNLSHLITDAIKPLPFEPIALSIKQNEQILVFINNTGINLPTGHSHNHEDLDASAITRVANDRLEITASSKIGLFYTQAYLGKLTLLVCLIITLLITYIVHISIRRHMHVVGLVEKKSGALKDAQKLLSKQARYLESKAKNKKYLTEIQHALLNNELRLYYQPKVNMRTGHVFGVEALIRWVHPTKGVIPPMDFLPVLEDTDLGCQIGDWVINQALDQLNDWQQQDIKLEISINISPHHLETSSFFSQLDEALAKYPSIDSKSLQLEIVETSALSNYETIGEVIKNCQERFGISVALDDFGTGYSSLAHLRKLPINIIKIDQTFIFDMLDDPNDYAIVDGVIGLADAFNRDIIAEGVETTEHGLLLLLNGCEQAQGYGIAKPMPADDIPQWLTHYTPNQDWLRCGNKERTVRESKIKLLKLIISHWKNKFITNIQSSPDDDKHWPIMDCTHCNCNDWLKRTKQSQLFSLQRLNNIDEAHKKLHALANDLQSKYQHGNTQLARDGLAELHIIFDDIYSLLN